jgi:hypothetical protein
VRVEHSAIAPQLLGELGLGEDTLRLARQMAQQGELALGQPDGLAGQQHQAAAGVDLQIAHAQHLTGSARSLTAQQRAQARAQLRIAHGPWHDVVGSVLERAQDIQGRVIGAEHDHDGVGVKGASARADGVEYRHGRAAMAQVAEEHDGGLNPCRHLVRGVGGVRDRRA